MEMNVLASEKRKMVFEVSNVDQGLWNVLKTELWNDENVEAAGYQIEHPLINKVKFTVETNTKETPQEAVADAIKRVKATVDKMAKGFSGAK
jgi:DNA-directed RNA polymerase subunit L